MDKRGREKASGGLPAKIGRLIFSQQGIYLIIVIPAILYLAYVFGGPDPHSTDCLTC